MCCALVVADMASPRYRLERIRQVHHPNTFSPCFHRNIYLGALAILTHTPAGDAVHPFCAHRRPARVVLCTHATREGRAGSGNAYTHYQRPVIPVCFRFRKSPFFRLSEVMGAPAPGRK